MKIKLKDICICALFSALLCICSVVKIPIGTVPVTLATFGVMLLSLVLGSKKASLCIAVYILLGLFGLPVFSGGSASAFIGPTGGYIWSYLFMPFIINFFVSKSKKSYFAGSAAGCGLALIFCYICGILQYAFCTSTNLLLAVPVCILPFLPADILKLVCALILSKRIKKAVHL